MDFAAWIEVWLGGRAIFPAELLTHAVEPEAVANVVAFLAGDLAAPVSGAIVPAYGA